MKTLLSAAALSLSTFAALLLTGCAQTICLRTVDSANNQPLRGVSTIWREDSAYNLLTARRHSIGPSNRLSDEQGVIKVAQIHKKWVSRFVFSHDGYTALYGIYAPGKLELAERIMPAPLPQDRFILEDPRVLVVPSNGCFLVEMKPVSH